VQDLARTGLSEEDARRIAELDSWCAEQLSTADLEFIRTFRPTLDLTLGDAETLLCFHGSPRSYRDVIRSDTPEAELERMFAGYRAQVMAGGHTHAQMLRLVNPGSVGLPAELDPDTGKVYNPPWAEYALVDWVNGRVGIDLRRMPVDVEAVMRAALKSGMPHAQWWAGDWRKS
jgi:hypothetical protein